MSKKDSGWRKRTQGTVNQIGQAFHLEPHGDRSKLPKSLQQVSFSEISDALEKRRKKGKTPQELAEDEMIDEAVREAIEERRQSEETKNLLQKLGDMLEKRDQKERLKAALEEAKQEQKENESAGDPDGYEGHADRIEEGKRRYDEANRENEVMG
jgi:hypothetical protein